jgi:hypothetical protein
MAGVWWTADVAPVGNIRETDGMNGFQCWFCGEGIDRTDANAAMVTIEGLWPWAEGTRRDDDPSQSIYVHSHCAKTRMAGATMDLETSIFGEED